MRVPKFIPALCAFFVLGGAVAGCGSGLPGNAVVSMAGNPISLQAINHWMYISAVQLSQQAPGQPVIIANDPPEFNGCIHQARTELTQQVKKLTTKQLRKACSQLFQYLYTSALQRLIPAYWYEAEASRDHITITDKQVQKELKTTLRVQYPTTAAYQGFLKQTGFTQEDVDFLLRAELINQKLVARQSTKVSQTQIKDYYLLHKSQYGTPETRNIELVLAKTQAKAAAAMAAIKSGQSWKAVAKKYSIDPSANSGGILTGVSQSSLEPTLAKQAFSAAKGTLVGPVKGQFGYYVFEITGITPATQQPLSKVQGQIQQQLLSQAQTTAATNVQNLLKKHWQAKTKCRSAYVMSDCAGYKAPKSSTTAGG